MTTTTKILLAILGLVVVVFAILYSTNKVNEILVRASEKQQSEMENARQQISEYPVSGSLHGQAFQMDRAEFSMDNNRLTLRQGGEFFPDREINVRLKEEEALPQGKTYVIKNESLSFAAVDIDIKWKPPGSKIPEHDFLMSTPVELYLEFSQLEGDQLPGKINIRVHDEFESHATGSFVATVTGHEGTLKPSDMTPDDLDHAFDVMKYLARGRLKEQYPEASIEDLKFITGGYIKSFGEQRESEVLVVFELNNGEAQTVRFQFGKNDGEWYVANVLRGDQLGQAHPLITYSEESGSFWAEQCNYLAAQHVEREIQKLFPGEYIKNVGPDLLRYFHASANIKFGRAKSRVAVELGSGKIIDRRFYCEKQQGTWVLAKELGAKEDINLETGEIEKRVSFLFKWSKTLLEALIREVFP